LEKHQDIFSALTINMIRAGEVSGSLQKSVSFVAENIEKNYQLTSKIRGALYYPIFVLGVAFIVGFLVVTFILPKITALIKDLNVPIPWYTQALIWLEDFMNQYWWAILLILLSAIGLHLLYPHRSGPARMGDRHPEDSGHRRLGAQYLYHALRGKSERALERRHPRRACADDRERSHREQRVQKNHIEGG
jgi:type II secretory pathway component PulF